MKRLIILLLATLVVAQQPNRRIKIEDHPWRLSEGDLALLSLTQFIRGYEQGNAGLALCYLSRDYEDENGLTYKGARNLLKGRVQRLGQIRIPGSIMRSGQSRPKGLI